MNLPSTFALLAVLHCLVTGSSNSNPPGLQKIPITCDAGLFNAGQDAEITCNFHRQMDQDKRGISVVRHSLNASESDPGTDILLCQWKEPKYDCWTGENYKFDGVITDRLTLEIPAVSREFGGLYFCFIVHSEDTQKHACALKITGDEISVQDVPGINGTDLQSPQDNTQHTWVIVVCVSGAVVLILVVIFWFQWKRRKTTQQNQTRSTDEENIPMINQPRDNSLQEERVTQGESLSEQNEKVKTLLGDFILSKTNIQRVYSLFCQRLLVDIETYIKRFDFEITKRKRRGQFLSLCISKEVLDIRLVYIRSAQVEIQRFHLPVEMNSGASPTKITEETFFDTVANSVAEVLKCSKLSEKTLTVEYQTGSPRGYDVIEKTPERTRMNDFDAGATKLQRAFKKNQHTHRLKIKPTVMDPVATLLSGLSKNSACSAAFLHDVEFEACYASKCGEQTMEISIIDFESLGENGYLDVFKTEFDLEVDKASKNPGKKTLGKMASLEYHREIVRLVLLKLSKEDGALTMAIPDDSDLHKVGGLTARHASLIESDLDVCTGKTNDVLGELKMKPEDSQTVKTVFRTILERSTILTAAILAALITVMNKEGDTIAVDGLMHQNRPYFCETIECMARTLVPEKLKKFKLDPQYDGRLVGAAMAAVFSKETTPVATAMQKKKRVRGKRKRGKRADETVVE